LKQIMMLFFVMVFFSTLALAAENPAADPTDWRLRNAIYNKNQVYNLRTGVGFATYIQLEKGEELAEWYSGDPEAWDVTSFKNLLTIKPKVIYCESNLIVVTNKERVYNFSLSIKNDPFYGVRFQYPESDRQRLAEAASKAEMDKNLKDSIHPYMQEQKNIAYIASGNEEIKPALAFDNGSYTYFYFNEGADLPAVYRKTPNGEKLTQRLTKDNWLIIPHVEKEWAFRLGEMVVCVKNLSKQDTPINRTSTSSDKVKLIIKEDVEGN